MEIKPGISTSLYISLILFVTAFSGQNSNSGQAESPADIAIHSVTDSLIEKNKTSDFSRDSGFRITSQIMHDSLNAHGTK